MTRLKLYQRLALVSGLALALLSHFMFGWISFFIPFARADAVTWVGASGYWNDPANWSSGVVPTTADDVLITGDNLIIFVSPTSTINFSTLTLGGPDVRLFLQGNIGTGTDITIDGGMIAQVNTSTQTISGTLTIVNGLLTHWAGSSTTVYKVDFAAQNIDIQPGGDVRVDNGGGYSGGAVGEDGYGGGKGQYGGGTSGAGGGNAGYGGYSQELDFGGFPTCEFLTYDSEGPVTPNYPGSGGAGSDTAAGGNGGGMVKLTATDTLTINGTVKVTGQDAHGTGAGGGSGGTVFISAGTITGTPVLFDVSGGDGSNPDGGGGSGGCVRIRYENTSSLDGQNFILDGGLGFQKGAAGLVMIEKKDYSDRRLFITTTSTSAYGVGNGPGLLGTSIRESADTSVGNIVNTFDDPINSLSISTSSVVVLSSTKMAIIDTYPFEGSTGGVLKIDDAEASLGFTSGAVIEGAILDVKRDDWLTTTRIVNRITGNSNLDLTIGNGSVLNLTNYTPTTSLDFNSLTVANGGIIIHDQVTGDDQKSMINIHADTITISNGAIVNAVGKGFTGVGTGHVGNGPGGGGWTGIGDSGAGGANGGDGGDDGDADSGGTAYCDVGNPLFAGSGGSGSTNNNSVTGEGIGGNGGGLVWLIASTTLTINGSVIADGANAGPYIDADDIPGGGAGGSIKLVGYTISGSPQLISAHGGTNGAPDPSSELYGGGGGGGCVRVVYTHTNTLATSSINLAGGLGGSGLDGGDGQINIIKENEAPELSLSLVTPTILGQLKDDVGLVFPERFALSGEYAYVTSVDGDDLQIIDISSSTHPVAVGALNDPGLSGTFSLAIKGSYAYVAAVDNLGSSLQIIDISSSTHPVIAGQIVDNINLFQPFSIAIKGDYAYVGNCDVNKFTVLNISNPTNPTVVASLEDNTRLRCVADMVISGNYAYLGIDGGDQAFTIVDISNPSSPVIVGSVEDANLQSVRSVAVSGNYAYFAARSISGSLHPVVKVVDISDPNNPTVVETLEDPEAINSPRSVSVSGKYLYVSFGSTGGIEVFDISNPLDLVSVGYTINNPLIQDPSWLRVVGNYAYLSDEDNSSFSIIDVAPEVGADATLSFFATDGDAQELSVKTEYMLHTAGTSCTYSGASSATLSDVTSTYGVAMIDNADLSGRQIQDVFTSTTPNRVTATWLSSDDVSGQEGEFCVFFTPYDGLVEGARIAGRVVVDDPGTAPATPSLSFLADETSITVMWGAVGGANSYVLSATADPVLTETSDTSVVFSGLTPATSYSFQIKSVDNFGNESNFSESVGFSTRAHVSSGGGAPPPPPPVLSDSSSSSTPSSTPSNPSGLILINGGDIYTNSPIVTLSFNTAFTTAYILSDTTDFTGKGYVPIVSSTSYTLSSGDGEKRVYARFSNTYGIYDAYDVITLDTLPPSTPTLNTLSIPGLVQNAKGTYLRSTPSSTTPIRPTLSGTAEPYSTITITRSSGILLSAFHLASVDTFETMTDSHGDWTYTFPEAFGNTTYLLTIQAADPAGNFSPATQTSFNLTTTGAEPIEEPPLCTTDCAPIEEPPVLPPCTTNCEPITPPTEPPCTTDCGGEPVTTPPDTTGDGGENTNTQNTSANGSSTETPNTTETEQTPTQEVISTITDSARVITDTVTTFFTEVGDAIQQIPGVASVTRVAGIAIEKTKEVINNPEVEQANETIAAPVIAAVAVVNVAAGGVPLLAQVMTYIRLIFSQPLLLLKRRKQKKWGVVFNAYTKQPLDLATVRLTHADTNTIQRTQVTDAKGRYFMVADTGEYRLEAAKEGFKVDSTDKHEDSVYPNVYTGEKLAITEETNELNYNIPLKPVLEEKTNAHLIKEYGKKTIQKATSLIGVIATIASLIISPKPWMTALLVGHIFVYGIIKRLSHKKIKGTYGSIIDADTHKSIAKTVVRVFDATYNKLVDSTVTDGKGRYAVLVGPGTYYVTAEKEGYVTTQSETINLSSEKTNGVGGVIAEPITLSKSGASTSNTKSDAIHIHTMPLL